MGKTVCRFLKNLKIGFCLMIQKYYSYEYTCRIVSQVIIKAPAHMFIATLFTIAKLWKESRCPTTDEWIKNRWYLYTMKFYSATKKNEILSFLEQMNGTMSGTREYHLK
jgi:hypothetical protein